MNRNEIEAKDQRLVKKIRTIVEQKENRVSRKQPFWKKPLFWVPVVCVVLVVSGLTAFRAAPPTAVPTAPEPAPAVAATDTGSADPNMAGQAAPADAQTDTEVAEQPSPADDQADLTMAEQSVPADRQTEVGADERESPVDAQADVAMAEQAAPAVPAPREEKTPETEGKPETPPAEPETPQTAAPAVASDAAAGEAMAADDAQPAAADKPVSSPGVEISHLVVCGGVKDKQFISPKSVFSVSADPYAVVWMRVLSADPPFTLTHVYWLNGKRYVDVPLEIRYPHMRTWSRVTLDRQRQIGQWRVDVVNETGQMLDQIEFTVGP